MKRFFLSALLLVLPIALWAAGTNIPGIVIPNTLTRGNSENAYPLARTAELLGTEKQVADATERDAILPALRAVGMVAYVVGEAKSYRLVGGVANTNWVEVVYSSVGQTNWPLSSITNSGTLPDWSLLSTNVLSMINLTQALAYVYSPTTTRWYPLTGTSNEQGVVLSLGQEGVVATNWVIPGVIGPAGPAGADGVVPDGIITNGQGGVTLSGVFSGSTADFGAIYGSHFEGDGEAITNIQAGNVVGLVAGVSVDAGGVPYTGELDISLADGHRGVVHPNWINLKTNWNGAQYWMTCTGAGSNLTTGAWFEKNEQVHVFSSSDFVNWTPRGNQPIITQSNAVALSGLYTSGWCADPEIYLAPDGTMRIIYGVYATSATTPVAGFVSNAVLCASSSDGSNWTHQVLHYGPQSISGTGIAASFVGQQIVRDATNGLRMYFVDDGLDTDGTNVFKFVPAVAGDTSGTNWNWAGEVSCTLTPYQTNRFAPWHFSLNYASGEYHLFYTSQIYSAGEYSTSTNGVNWSPAGFGVFTDQKLLNPARTNEYSFYKSALRPVAGPSGLAWDGLVNTMPFKISDAVGWKLKAVRGLVVDTKRLSYALGNTNIILIGGERGGSQQNATRRAALSVLDDSGGTHTVVNIGKTSGSECAIGFGDYALGAATAALIGDGLTYTLLQTPSATGILEFKQNNTIRGGIQGSGGGMFVGGRPGGSVPAGSMLATSFIGSAAPLTNYYGTNINSAGGTTGQVLTVSGTGAVWSNGTPGPTGQKGEQGIPGISGTNVVTYTNNAGSAGVLSGVFIGTNVWGTNVLTATGTHGQVLTVTASGARWQTPAASESVVNALFTKSINAQGATNLLLMMDCATNSSASLTFEFAIQSQNAANPETNAIYREKVMFQTASANGVLNLWQTAQVGAYMCTTSTEGNGGGGISPMTFMATNSSTRMSIFGSFAYTQDGYATMSNNVMRIIRVENLSTNAVTVFP